MEFSFEKLNPYHGDETIALKFHDTVADKTEVILLDSGKGVDIQSQLDDDENLTAILLTHAHSDHYWTLAKNASPGIPIYTAPDTTDILEQVLTEGEQYLSPTEATETAGIPDAGWDTDLVLDSLVPIDGWNQVSPNVEIHPYPVGHTPGATGFIIRFSNDVSEKYILITGDFTFNDVAGYQGLEEPLINIDCLFLNTSTYTTVDDRTKSHYAGGNLNHIDTEMTDSLQTMLSAATAGSPVLVSANALVGVHFGVLLETIADQYDIRLNVSLVGQAAKLYEDLQLPKETVTTVPTFESTDGLLSGETITIAGPATPTAGSSGRLYESIQADSNATLIQIGAGNDELGPTSCTTHTFEYHSHPPKEAVKAFVESLVPMEVVAYHGRLKPYKDLFPMSFTWAVDEQRDYTLFADEQWQAPHWLNESTKSKIRANNYRLNSNKQRIKGAAIELPSVDRFAVDLKKEGMDLNALDDFFDQRAVTTADSTSPSETDDTPRYATVEPRGATDQTPVDPHAPALDTTHSDDHLLALEERIARLEDQLQAEDTSDKLQTVTATVLRASDGPLLLAPETPEAITADHGETLRLKVVTSDSGD